MSQFRANSEHRIHRRFLVYSASVRTLRLEIQMHELDPSPRSVEPPERLPRTIRVFISSTFDDLKAERNALQERVFPRLRRYCARHGWTFQAIDLRWGVSAEAALDQRTMRICLTEIVRCQLVTPRPNFVVLLGDRYGWRPLPPEIPAVEFSALERRLTPEEKQCYRLDRNATGGGVWVLQPRTGRFADEDTWAHEVENPVREALIRAAREAGLSDRERLKYEASATEQEVDAGALAQVDAQEHVLAFFREIRMHDGQPLARVAQATKVMETYLDCMPSGAVDSEATARLDALKQRLREHLGPNQVHSRTVTWNEDGIGTEHLGWLCVMAYRELRRIIRDQIRRHEALDPWREERLQHDRFAWKRSRDFTARAAARETIAHYIQEGGAPLVMHGPSGCGKSALLAQAALECKSKGMATICRFVGVTANSMHAPALVEGICREIEEIYGAAPSELPAEFDLLMEAFRQRLALATAERPLIVFLDALDQLGARPWHWISETLPPHARLVVSTTPGPALEWLRSCLPENRFHHLEAMAPEDGRALLGKWLTHAGRRLTEDQITAVMEGFAGCGLPLYLRLAFEEAQQWRSYDAVPVLRRDVDGMVEQLLERLSAETNHGRLLVSRAVGYLRCARQGLAEGELLDLLAKDEDYCTHFSQHIARHELPVRQLPMAIWLRLYQDLSPYLSWRSSGGVALMTFFHAAFGAAADRWYPDGDSGSWNRERANRRMGTYFQGIATPKRRGRWAAASSRALSELSYQRRSDVRRRYMEHLFYDVRFIATAISRGLVNQIIEDLEATATRPMRDAVMAAIAALRARPELALVTIVNRLRNDELPPVAAAYLRRAEAEMDRAGIWLCAKTRFGVERMITDVATVSPLRGVFHTLAGRRVDEYNLATHELIARRTLPPTEGGVVLAAHPTEDRLAWADRIATYLDGQRVPLALRPYVHCFGFLDDGLVGVDEAHSLVWFDAMGRRVSTLVGGISPLFAPISFTPDHRAAVVISGDRLPDQRVWLLRAEHGEVIASEWPRPASPVCAACVNESASIIVLATRGRQLKMYDSRTGSVVREASYRIASGTAVRGVVKQCCALSHNGRLHFVLATNEGELLAWDTDQNVVRRRGMYRGLVEQAVLCALEPISSEGRFVMVTSTRIETLTVDSEDTLIASLPITQCSSWGDGWLVTASAAGKSVKWYEGVVYRDDFVSNCEPVAVAACGEKGAAYVGYSNGVVRRLEPGQKPGPEDGLELFDHAVRAVVALNQNRVLAASERGEYKIARFRPADVERVIPHVDHLREERFVCLLGEDGDFVSSGRYQAGSAHTSVVVVRVDGSRETILETRNLTTDLAAAGDGNTVYVALKDNTRQYKCRRRKWELQAERALPVAAIRVTPNGMPAVVRIEHGCWWLELWSDAEGLPTIAATELPLVCSSMAVARTTIAVGAVDGRLCWMEIRGPRGAQW